MNQWLVAVAEGVAMVPVMWAVSSVLERRRRARRVASQCYRCAQSLDPTARYRVDGRVVCASCAAKLRRRIWWASWLYAALLIGMLGFGLYVEVVKHRRGEPFSWVAFGFFLVSIAFLGGVWVVAVRGMKAANAFGESQERMDLTVEFYRDVVTLLKDDERRAPGA